MANRSKQSGRIIYIISTALIVLFEGAGSLWFNSEPARQGISHLGFPGYFRVELGIAKILGAIVLAVPAFPPRVKEWAYAGFGITLLSAAIGNAAVDGFAMALMPAAFLIILVVSYIYFHKTAGQAAQNQLS